MICRRNLDNALFKKNSGHLLPILYSNPLDYSFWDAVKLKVYEGRITPFSNIKELKDRIRRVWKRACNIDVLRKSILQFRPRLNAVAKEKGRPIKSDFG